MNGETLTLTLTAEEFRGVRLCVSEMIDAHDRDARRWWADGDEYLAKISEQNRDRFRALWIALGERVTA